MASKYGGYMGKVLQINLTSLTVSEYPWSDEERELFLGGKIMAAKILYDQVMPGVEPFDPENYLVVTTGPLTGTSTPSSSRFNISTLSPMSGGITSSNCGGSFGMHLKRAGYDGLVITGKAAKPLWIEIHDEKVVFHEAAHLWGKGTGETQEMLGERTGKMVIGPAGENLVRYAAIFSGERTAGRAGVGAVMGSKQIKAIVVSGTHKVPIHNLEKTKNLNKVWVEQIMAHPMTGEILPKYGTAGLLRPMNNNQILATRNYQRGQFKDFAALSGETLAEKHLIKNKGCITCPIQCGRLVELDGKQIKGPELETLGLLGSNLENNSMEKIIRWNWLLDELGMDTISTGSTIGFAMELNEKGLWKNGLKFGQTDKLEELFKDIAHRRGIGDLLAEGTKRLADKFGGRDFAINSKGLELAAYEPRRAVGLGLGYAVSNRGGCHLNAGYMVILEGLGLKMNPQTRHSKAALTVMFQNLMEAVSAAGSCVFTTYAMIPGALIKEGGFLNKVASKALGASGPFVNLVNWLPGKMLPFNLPALMHNQALSNVTGMKMTFGRFKEIGERGYNLERMFNVERGLSRKDDSLPKRLTEELQNIQEPYSRVPLEALKRDYYWARGWDQNGIPRVKKLQQLSLHTFKRDSRRMGGVKIDGHSISG